MWDVVLVLGTGSVMRSRDYKHSIYPWCNAVRLGAPEPFIRILVSCRAMGATHNDIRTIYSAGRVSVRDWHGTHAGIHL